MDLNPKISNSIQKMGGVIPSFNITPIKSCPQRTLACVIYCYALLGRFRFPSAMERLWINYKATKRASFVEIISNQISLAVTYFRIHSAGDFYSQKYFDKWCEIARLNPRTQFLAYTRNYTLKTKRKPTNLKLYYTVDNTTTGFPTDDYLMAKVIYESIDEHEHLEPYNDGLVCNSKNCATCLQCWDNEVNIYFPQKYGGKNKKLIQLTVPL